MNYREYQRLKTDAENEYRRKLEAIETVWKLSGGLTPKGFAAVADSNGTSLNKGSLQEAIRKAYKGLYGDFTHRDVYNQIATFDAAFAEKIKEKLASLSGGLKRMADDGELVLVEPGSGKRASKYRKAG
jgi:hypothetical protein